MPTSAASAATPSAPPTCRPVWLRPTAAAKRSGLTESAAAVEMPVVIAPVPIPIRTPTGSQKLRKLGVSGSANDAHRARGGERQGADGHRGRGVVRRAAASATTAAMIAPGVMARPASSGE